MLTNILKAKYAGTSYPNAMWPVSEQEYGSWTPRVLNSAHEVRASDLARLQRKHDEMAREVQNLRTALLDVETKVEILLQTQAPQTQQTSADEPRNPEDWTLVQ